MRAGTCQAGRRGLRAVAFCAATLAVLVLPAAGQSASIQRQVLSHPGHFSTWAYLERATDAYAFPSKRARVLGWIGLTTQDGTSQLVLEQQREFLHGDWWVQVRLPLRPAGQIGWIRQRTLGAPQTVDTYLVVSTERMTLTLYRAGRIIFVAPVGPGKPSTPTPHGQFYIRDRLTGFPSDSLYGPLAFGTSALSNVETDWPGGGVIGIHGTDEPWLIPGHPSHGCIRLRNADILRLGQLLPIGTPLTIE